VHKEDGRNNKEYDRETGIKMTEEEDNAQKESQVSSYVLCLKC
jgi:hypothetical protein